MRQASFKYKTKDSVAYYPDEMCFAFNPNFIEIESEQKTGVLTLVVGKSSGRNSVPDQSIKVSLYEGKARVYISRLLELMFDEPRVARCVSVNIQLKDGSTSLLNISELLVIWGNLAVGERFGNLGVFNREKGSRSFERRLIWFKNFPFSVSLFKYSYDVAFYGRSDEGRYGTDPIVQDGRIVFFHRIDKLTADLPTLQTTSASSPDEIIYYAVKKRFIARKGNNFYGTWTGDTQCLWNDGTKQYGDSTDYCDTANGNHPVANVTYLTNEEWERYRYLNGELTFCGMFSDLGFEDIPAVQMFPTAQHSATIKYKILLEDRMTSVFDRTFDLTFFHPGENVALITLDINTDTAGYYLRWVDRHGNIQFFLFTKGTTQWKNKLSSDQVLQDEDIHGLYFANVMRTRHLDCSVTKKCCAVNLPDDIYEYVVTIVSAPIVDLYLGKDEDGLDIWLPVTIQSSTPSHNPNKQLNDLEISFNLPDISAQTL